MDNFNEFLANICIFYFILRIALGDQQQICTIDMPPKKAATKPVEVKETVKEPVKRSTRAARNKRELSEEEGKIFELIQLSLEFN